jgi:hypothetical protein
LVESDAVQKIRNADIGVFTVNTATTLADRRSLLLVQNLCRTFCGSYSYAEIGSQDGGSLLPHLIEPDCIYAASIDKRPDLQPDERARVFDYRGVTTAAMIENVRPYVALSGLKKLSTFECDASDLAPSELGRQLDLVLIDGEHTNVAAFSDFMSMLPMLSENALVLFHDDNLLTDAIENILRVLTYLGVPHHFHYLPDVVGLLALRRSRAPAAAQFGGIAHEPATFIRNAKRGLCEAIAQAVAEGAHLATV